MKYAVSSVRSSLQYRANLYGFLVITVVTYAFRLAFLERLVDIGDGQVGGWNRSQILNLYYVGLIVSLISWSLASSVDMFFRHAHQGDLDGHLMRPVSVPTILMLRWAAGPNLLGLALVLPLAIVDRWSMITNIGPLRLSLAGLGIILAVVSVVSAMVMTYSLTLILQREIPVDYIFSELFRLVQVPPTVFTGSWSGLLVVGLPMVLGVWAPVSVLEGSFLPLLGLAVVATLTLMTAIWAVRKSLAHFDGLGG